MYKNAKMSKANSPENGRGFLSMRLSEFGWFLLFNLLAFQIYFQDDFGGLFNYCDELTVIIVLIRSLFLSGSQKIRHQKPILCASFLLFIGIIFGLLGNTFFQIQDSILLILVDLFTFIKVPLLLCICSVNAFSMCSRDGHLWGALVSEAKFLISITAACAFVTLVSGGALLGMGGEVRYGITSFQFIFYHPEVVNLFALGLLLILIVDNPQSHRFMILLGLFVMCSTLRTKAFGFVALVFLSLYIRRGMRVSMPLIFFGLIVAVLLAWGQISNYYQNDAQARSLLTRDSFDVASDYFPLGSGFATFGSAVTALDEGYSPLYYQYGYDTVYGLSPQSTSYISDAFWPTITSQLGYIGGVCYVFAVLILLHQVSLPFVRLNRNAVVVIFISYLAISSTSASALFAPQWVYLAFVLSAGRNYLVLIDCESGGSGSDAERDDFH